VWLKTVSLGYVKVFQSSDWLRS